MGNTGSNNNKKKHAIDHEIINIQSQQVNETKNQKTYFITYQQNRALKLCAKIIDNNVLIYINDLTDNKNDKLFHDKLFHDKLIYVSKISVNTTNSLQMIEYYLKFIQISQDFKLLSIPEFDKINIYELTNDVEQLKYVGTINVTFELEKNTNILKTYIEEQSIEPLKCTLYSNTYTIVCFQKDNENITKYMIVTFDFIENKSAINSEISNTKTDTVTFSLNGKYIMWNNRKNRQLKIYDTMDGLINTKNNFENNPECISNDGLIILCTMNQTHNEKIMIKMDTNTVHHIQLHGSLNKNMKYYLVNNDQINIDVRKDNDNKLYILIGWDQCLKRYLYWLIQFTHTTKEDHRVSDSWMMNFDEYSKIEYIHHNGNTFMYKTANMMIIYEIKKIIPIKYVEMYVDEFHKSLKKLYEKYYTHKKYYDNLEIIAADDSTRIYVMRDFMKFLMSMQTNNNETNVFQLRVTANINIYGTTKSFDIFQKLILRESDGSEIIESIMLLPEVNGRHCVMSDLLMHIYEYIRVIVLKELDEKKPERTEIENIVSLYIGYTILSFVLKYYLVLSKIQKHEIIKYDILHTFSQNFPVFEKFIGKSIAMIVNASQC